MPEPGDTGVMAGRRREEEIEQVVEQYRTSGLTQMSTVGKREWSY
jgi:hypothetical protein